MKFFVEMDEKAYHYLRGAFEKASERYDPFARAAMEEITEKVVRLVSLRTPVNWGVLISGISKVLEGSGLSLSGSVVNPVSYAMPVEYGISRGNFPAFDGELRGWVEKKLGVPKEKSLGVAFLIARAISRGRSRGTANRGVRMFGETFEGMKHWVPQMVDKANSEFVKAVAGGTA